MLVSFQCVSSRSLTVGRNSLKEDGKGAGDGDLHLGVEVELYVDVWADVRVAAGNIQLGDLVLTLYRPSFKPRASSVHSPCPISGSIQIARTRGISSGS